MRESGGSLRADGQPAYIHFHLLPLYPKKGERREAWLIKEEQEEKNHSKIITRKEAGKG
jgi:hypothetical protein